MLDEPHPPRRRRRWFQFGLSTLLLMTLLAAVLLAWQRERLSRWVESFLGAPPAEVVKDPRDPKQVVEAFLRDFPRGDPKEFEKLLSGKAREVIRRDSHPWSGAHANEQRQGSNGAQPKQDPLEEQPSPVLNVRTFEDGTAHVDVMMVTYIVWRWLLREEAEGWRITGFIMPQTATRGVKIDFEDGRSPSGSAPEVTVDFKGIVGDR